MSDSETPTPGTASSSSSSFSSIEAPEAPRPPETPTPGSPDAETVQPEPSSPLRVLGTVLGRFFPSPALLILVGAGVGTEALLLLSRGDARLSGLGLVLALGLLFWIWLTGSWFLHVTLRLTGAQGLPRPARMGLTAALTFLTVLFGAFYVGSWSSFLQSGMFLDYSALAYLAIGYRFVVHIMLQNSRTVLLLSLLGIVAVCSLIPPALAWMRRSRWSTPSPVRPAMLAFLGWLTATACWVWPAYLASEDLSSIRKSERELLVKRNLNPLLTLILSTVACRMEPPVPASLDTAALTPLPSGRPAHAAARYPDPARRRHGFFLGVDSFRADVLFAKVNGREITPNLNRLASESAVFTNCYAQSSHTDYALVSCLSSLYPLRRAQHFFYTTTDPWPKTMIYDLLKPWGYHTAILTSDNTTWGRMKYALKTPRLDLFVDAETDITSATLPTIVGVREEYKAGVIRAGNIPDQITTDRIVKWIHANAATSTPLFLHSFFQDTHFPYEVPQAQEHPFQPCDVPQGISFAYYPPDLADNLRNAYYNAVLHVDRQFGRILDALRETGLAENSIVVIFGDHGEAFHEKGMVTHASAPIQPVIRVPCLIYAPGLVEPVVDDYPVEQVDMVPTVCALMGMEPHPNFQGINVLDPGRPPAEERRLFVHVESPLASADVVIEGGRWKLWVDQTSGGAILLDVVNDPGEDRNLLRAEMNRARRLFARLESWQNSQLAYYRYPFYYDAYYPPKY